MRAAFLMLALGADALAAPAPPLRYLDPQARYAVPIDGYPSRGRPEAFVTLVGLVDFASPFSRASHSAVTGLEHRYRELRLVLIPNPTSDPDSQLAAEAFFAAHEQGKLFELRDRLDALAGPLDRAAIETAAEAVGMRVKQLRQRLDSHFFADKVASARAMALRLGAVGTPTFFLDGHPMAGEVTTDSLGDLVESELPFAAAVRDQVSSVAEVYPIIMSEALAQGADEPSAVIRRPGADRDGGAAAPIYVPVGSSPVIGAPTAQVTIAAFLDFQCPFSGRLWPNLRKLAKQHPEVRLVFKHRPLPFHANARPAAEAAMAAAAQGKFFEMADLLFEHQTELNGAAFEADARKLGLDLARFKKDLAAHAGGAAIDADDVVAGKSGVSGTPTSFVNGTPLVGAQPATRFEEVVAQAAAAARAAIAAGTPANKVYDATARAQPAEHRPPSAAFNAMLRALTACRDGKPLDAAEAYWGLSGPRRALVIRECRELGVALSE